jgi:hypothetical protein
MGEPWAKMASTERGFSRSCGPALWKNQKAFNDITVGNNGFYSAAVGPDPCSGIGSPIAASIAALFVTSS